MDRMIVQSGAIPLDSDLLNTNRFAMIGLGMALQAILGTSTVCDALPCTPGPGAMQANIGAGSLYSLTTVDATTYGSLPADTIDQIVKQGVLFGSAPFTFTAPGTVGFSQVFLIEAQYQDADANPQALLYFNASNPTQPITGAATNTFRKGIVALQVKAGTAATTGTQVSPAPDAGWVPLYTVTLANGQTSITSANIAVAASAPFISAKLPDLSALVSGYLAINVGGNSNVTLSGAQYRNKILTFVGVLTGDIAVIFPANAGDWQIQNLTSGAFSITCRTAAGTGVTVAQGKTRRIFGDGVNIYAGVTDFTDAALLGTPTAPTPTTGDNSTKVATTAFVQDAAVIASLGNALAYQLGNLM